jgi:hypothetical protein
MWEDAYREIRYDAGLLLDLFGYVPSEHTRRELARAIREYRDPRLLTFAAGSLLRSNESVPAETIRHAASSAEMRNTLHGVLEKVSHPELFPPEWRTQEAFAESEMVDWLVFPTELGQVPDEIELAKVVSAGPEGDKRDFFVFRFRMHEPHWAAKDGWMAGIAGAYVRRDQPTTAALGDTFSRFEPWESKSPEDHVGAVTDLLSDGERDP